MKKNLLLLTLLLAGGSVMSVGAAADLQKSATAPLHNVIPKAKTTVSHGVRANEPSTRAGETIENLYGLYNSEYKWWLSGKDPYGMNPMISPGSTPDSFYLTNFPVGAGTYIEGTYDAENSRIEIGEQYLYNNAVYDMGVYFQIWNDIEGGWENSITAEVGADGKITFEPGMVMCYHMPEMGDDEGFLYGVYDVVLTPVEVEGFVYDPEEWFEYGLATFADNCILGLGMFEEEDYDDLAIKVPLYKHKEIPGEFLLLNPYIGVSTTSWGGFSMEEMLYLVLGSFNIDVWVKEPGFIRFNASNPDCVYLYPNVPSGVYTSLFDQFYIYNAEGKMIEVDGYTPDEVIDSFWSQGKDVSFYDTEDGVAYIFNAFMGYTSNVLSDFNWLDGAPGALRIKFQYDPENETFGPSDSFTLTASGKEIKDGDVIDIEPHFITSYDLDGEVIVSLTWDAEIFAAADLDDTQITITVNSDDTGFNICWPNTCKFVTPGVTFVETGVLSTTAEDLQVHCTSEIPAGLVADAANLTARFNVMDISGNEINFVVNCIVPDNASVKSVEVPEKNVSIYNMTGAKTGSLTKGVNIIKYSDGTVKKVIIK